MNTVKTELIDSYITENKISKTEFCRRCKIGMSTLKKIYDNNNNYGIIALFKIARVIKISICELFNV